MTVINTNVGALQARTYAVRADSSVTKAMERLSSGLRINSAADDAAGLAVANKMESQIRGMNMAIRNSQDGISLVQTAEAAMGEINNMVIRMRELAVQMNNGVYTDADRANAQLEVNALLSEIDKVANNSAFNQVKILDGTYSQDIRAGNTNPEIINVTIDRMNTDALGGGRITRGVEAATGSTTTAKNFATTLTAKEGRPTIALTALGLNAHASLAANTGGTYSIIAADSNSDHAKFAIVNNEITLDPTVTGNNELNFVSGGGNSAASTNSYSFKVTYTQNGVTVTDDVTLNIEDKEVTTATGNVDSSSTLTVEESACVKIQASSVLSDQVNEFIGANSGSLTYGLDPVSGNNANDLTNGGFSINTSTGEILASLDFERPTDVGSNNSYEFMVTVSNGTTTMRETVTLNVTDFENATDTADDADWASATTNTTDIDQTGTVINFRTDGGDTATVDLDTLLTESAAFFTEHPDTGSDGWSLVSVGGSDPTTAGVVTPGLSLSANGELTWASGSSTTTTINNVVVRYTGDDGAVLDVTMNITGASTANYDGSQTTAGSIESFANAINVDLALNTGGNPASDTSVTLASISTNLTDFVADHGSGAYSLVSVDGSAPTTASTLAAGITVNTTTGAIGVDQSVATAGSLDNVHIRYTGGDGRVFDLYTDITVTDSADATVDNTSFMAASNEAINGAIEGITVKAGGEAATLDLKTMNDSKFEGLSTFYDNNPCGLFTIERVLKDGAAVTSGDPTMRVDNSGNLTLDAGIAAGVYTAEVYYEDNEGDVYKQSVEITVEEVGIRGENVSARTTANTADKTAVATASHASTATQSSTEQVAGVSVISINEARQGTIQSISKVGTDGAVSSAGILSSALDEFARVDYAGGSFTISGTDAELFTIDASTGDISTKGLVDYESKTSYSFSVTYTNGSNVYREDVTMNVADDNSDNTTHIANVDLGTQANSAAAVTILDQAINQISSSQAKLGAIQNRLQYNIDNLSKATMLTQTAKGRIMDADFAAETSELSKQQILSQAATSMLAQANQSKQSVLALLQ